MSREENVDAIVAEFPFKQEPTSAAIRELRDYLYDCDPRRLKRMRRQLEDHLHEQTH